jgi:hypothetical protein
MGWLTRALVETGNLTLPVPLGRVLEQRFAMLYSWRHLPAQEVRDDGCTGVMACEIRDRLPRRRRLMEAPLCGANRDIVCLNSNPCKELQGVSSRSVGLFKIITFLVFCSHFFMFDPIWLKYKFKIEDLRCLWWFCKNSWGPSANSFFKYKFVILCTFYTVQYFEHFGSALVISVRISLKLSQKALFYAQIPLSQFLDRKFQKNIV